MAHSFNLSQHPGAQNWSCFAEQEEHGGIIYKQLAVLSSVQLANPSQHTSQSAAKQGS
jgi:hypothetical protein